MAKLTERQRRFIDHYIETGNAAEAARLAGYKQPQVQGGQNLGKLRAEIDKRLEQLESNRIASATEVMQYLTAVLRGEETEQVPIFRGDGVQQLETKDISAKDRLKAAELLGKRYGLFTDKVQAEVSQRVVIVDDVED